MWMVAPMLGNGKGMPVTYEMTVGLHVIDEAAYAEYRAGMTPLLQRRIPL